MFFSATKKIHSILLDKCPQLIKAQENLTYKTVTMDNF